MAMKLAAAVNAAIAMNLATAETRIAELVKEKKLVAPPHCKDYHEEFQGNTSTYHAGGTCFFHLQWAMDKGIETHPDWYPNGTTASVADVQCALYLKEIGEDDGTSHSCDLPPCATISLSMQNGADPTVDITKCMAPAPTPVPTPVPAPSRSGDFVITLAPTPSEAESTTEAPASSSLPTWAIALLVVAGCACIGGPLAIFGLSKKPKKTRAVKSSLTAPEEEDEDMSQFGAYPVAPASSTQLPVATPAGSYAGPQYGTPPQYGYGGAPQYGQYGSYSPVPAYAQPRPY